MSNELPPILRLDDVPPCGHCGRPGLVLTRFPYSWKNQRGEDVPGFREALLCSSCDASDPAATQLLALFNVNDQLQEQSLPLLAELAADWTEEVASRKVNEQDLADEEERFQRGEL